MITIGKPRIEKKGNEFYLSSEIYDENRKQRFDIWYSVSEEYGEYLCDDRADAYISLVLSVAIISGQDIVSEAPVSARFLHGIRNTIQPILHKLYGHGDMIHITVPQERPAVLSGTAVGCGCSLGVDSLSSLYSHMGDDVELGYHVTHLALFNSCQFGGSQEQSIIEKAFKEGVEKIKPFANEVGLPIVAINTNLNEFFVNTKVGNLKRFICTTLSCPLALQKLFGKYIFASSYSATQFEFSSVDPSHCESAYVPLFSTDSMEIVLSNPILRRVDKTIYISKNPLTKKYLDVCVSVQLANSGGQDQWLEGKEKLNCGWCDKCLRTLLTLEIIGKLDGYDEIFDMEKYKEHREQYIYSVIRDYDRNLFYQEIYSLMHEHDFRVPFHLTIKAKGYRFLRRGYLLIWSIKRYVFNKMKRT